MTRNKAVAAIMAWRGGECCNIWGAIPAQMLESALADSWVTAKRPMFLETAIADFDYPGLIYAVEAIEFDTSNSIQPEPGMILVAAYEAARGLEFGPLLVTPCYVTSEGEDHFWGLISPRGERIERFEEAGVVVAIHYSKGPEVSGACSDAGVRFGLNGYGERTISVLDGRWSHGCPPPDELRPEFKVKVLA